MVILIVLYVRLVRLALQGVQHAYLVRLGHIPWVVWEAVVHVRLERILLFKAKERVICVRWDHIQIKKDNQNVLFVLKGFTLIVKE